MENTQHTKGVSAEVLMMPVYNDFPASKFSVELSDAKYQRGLENSNDLSCLQTSSYQTVLNEAFQSQRLQVTKIKYRTSLNHTHPNESLW